MFARESTGRTVASSRVMRALRALGVLLILAVVPATASAVTIDQIVSLKQAGVTDAVVLALIERDHTVFTLQPEQIVALQRDGLSEAIIIAMLKSAQAGDDAARAESAATTAAVAAAIAPAPEVLIVGHGPERPNTYPGFFVNNPLAYGSAVAGYPAFGSYGYPVAYGYPMGAYAARPRWAPRLGSVQSRSLCYAQVNSSASRGNSPSFVTECPRVMQSRRLR